MLNSVSYEQTPYGQDMKWSGLRSQLIYVSQNEGRISMFNKTEMFFGVKTNIFRTYRFLKKYLLDFNKCI